MSKILVIEDNEMNLDVITRRLVRKGFDVVSARDGVEGMDVAMQEQPDLILLDLSLPRVDGWTLARLLRAEPKTKHIPIIALTAHAMVGDRNRAMEAGCDDYATKPVDLVRLLEQMHALLGAPDDD
ncbi:response regulator [Haliangium sp.]|uniref:response regulator n=1 Tax=Haliangium sp. TaxID=2663208 RepID=UPI003D0F8901